MTAIAPDLLTRLQALRSYLDEVLRAFPGTAPIEPRPAVNPNTAKSVSANFGGRRYRYWLFGVERTAPKAIASTMDILQNLAQYDDGFFSKLAPKVRGRTRNYLAPSPSDLYPERPDLARYAKKIAPGWYIDGNIANRDKVKIIHAVCKVMGIVFGRDLILDWPNKNGADRSFST